MIRIAQPDDASSIASVLKNSFEEYRPLYTPDAFEATIPTSGEIRARMNEGPVWVAVQEYEIVGTVSVVPRKDELYIRGMAVDPAARKLGIAQRLLEYVERYAAGNGYKTLTLCTTPFLHGAIQLYEKCGFRFIKEIQRDLFGTPLLTMIKNNEEISS